MKLRKVQCVNITIFMFLSTFMCMNLYYIHLLLHIWETEKKWVLLWLCRCKPLDEPARVIFIHNPHGLWNVKMSSFLRCLALFMESRSSDFYRISRCACRFFFPTTVKRHLRHVNRRQTSYKRQLFLNEQ